MAGTDARPLAGRAALVTGASRGIGAAIAQALDAAGARVALTARSPEALHRQAERLHHDPVVLEADLASARAPAELARRALEALGRLDILVNNAAEAARLPSVEVDAALVDRLYAVNVRAPLLLTSALIPALAERRGSVINISSVSGVVGTPKRAAYAATKGALDAMGRSLAVELGPLGIRVNSVAPGVVDTDMWAKNKAVPGLVAHIEEQTPLRRWSRPDDIAGVVVFLASDAAAMITGETVCADGGLARTLDLYGGAV
ncbi:MAG TPA: glucose 1-dehydrogenase [Acidimicrobiales bacterium]|nr:glucose 1-dehydrogenase [Acidimicrobiales bacterium]